jgi:putative transposase
LKAICLEIVKRYEVHFVEIGTDEDHAHFLIQSVPIYSPTKIARLVKSITAREMFKRRPEVKQKLCGGEFWSDGYYISTVGKQGNEDTIQRYVKNQGKEQLHYTVIHKDQLRMGF